MMEEGLWAFLAGKGVVIAALALLFVVVSLASRALLRRLPEGRLKEWLSLDASDEAIERNLSEAEAILAANRERERERLLVGADAGRRDGGAGEVGSQRLLDQDTVAGRKPGE